MPLDACDSNSSSAYTPLWKTVRPIRTHTACQPRRSASRKCMETTASLEEPNQTVVFSKANQESEWWQAHSRAEGFCSFLIHCTVRTVRQLCTRSSVCAMRFSIGRHSKLRLNESLDFNWLDGGPEWHKVNAHHLELKIWNWKWVRRFLIPKSLSKNHTLWNGQEWTNRKLARYLVKHTTWRYTWRVSLRSQMERYLVKLKHFGNKVNFWGKILKQTSVLC